MKKVNFKVLENLGVENVFLQCHECSQVFVVNAITELNLIWDNNQKMFVVLRVG